MYMKKDIKDNYRRGLTLKKILIEISPQQVSSNALSPI